MKKVLTITLFFCGLVVANLSVAQTSFGLRVGLSSNTMTNSPLVFPIINESQTKPLISYDITAFVNIPVSKALSFQPEIHYLQKGQVYVRNYSYNFQDYSLKTTHSINFIEVPLLFKYTLLAKKSFKPFITVGGSVGYALSQKLDGDVLLLKNTGDVQKTEWGSNNAKDNRTDISAVVGIGVQKTIGKNTLILDLRYNNDFTDWREQSSTMTTTSTGSVTNRGIALSAGISF